MNIKLYGNYYKIFKKGQGIPEPITVVKIRDKDILFILGHHTEEELSECGRLDMMSCKPEWIIQKLSDSQKRMLQKIERKVKMKEEQKLKWVNKIYQEFDVKVPFLSWSGMDEDELEDLYYELEIEQNYNCGGY